MVMDMSPNGLCTPRGPTFRRVYALSFVALYNRHVKGRITLPHISKERILYGIDQVSRRSSFNGTIHRICKRIGVVAFLLCNTYGAIAQQKYIDLNEFVSTTIANDKTGDLEREARERLTRRYPNPKDESYWKTAPIVVGINPKAKVQNITILDTTYTEGNTSYSPGKRVLFQKNGIVMT
jgi:hypothetical protein